MKHDVKSNDLKTKKKLINVEKVRTEKVNIDGIASGINPVPVPRDPRKKDK